MLSDECGDKRRDECAVLFTVLSTGSVEEQWRRAVEEQWRNLVKRTVKREKNTVSKEGTQ